MSSEFILNQIGKRLPNWRLQDRSLRQINPSDFRNRKNLIVVLASGYTAPDLSRLWQDFALEKDQFEFQSTQIIFILPGSADELKHLPIPEDFPFWVVSDESNEIFGSGEEWIDSSPAQLTILVADRFGEIFQVFQCSKMENCPTVNELLDWVAYIELECPE